MSQLTRSEKLLCALCALYALTAVVALVATWSNNLAFMQQPENRDVGGWYQALYANYAAASFTNDLLLLGLAVCLFIGVEGRRLKIRFYWAYILLSGPTAISFTFPLFMIARQVALAQRRVSPPPP